MSRKRPHPFPAELLGLLGLDAWWPYDVPRWIWDDIPGLHRRHDAFAVLGSGCPSCPVVRGDRVVVAGFEVLCHEPRPWPNEPEGNAYRHEVYTSGVGPGPTLWLSEPSIKSTLTGHWFDYQDLVAIMTMHGLPELR